jgi:2,4-dienoyl-CoA reductase-like NADH-dependent reductase (Old Yellow Enzyme family)/thioredoxin reductase
MWLRHCGAKAWIYESPWEQAMDKYQHIFKPLQIGRLSVKNRIEFPPVGPLLACNGLVTRELIEWGRSFARGGAGIVTLGDSAIIYHPDMPGGNALNLGSDRAINPLNTFAEAVQRYGAMASLQLNYHVSFLPAEISLEDIHRIVTGFAQAAYRCLQAGMNMVLVHGAHGQIISQFVSPRKNLRTDSYGGNLRNRARFAIEILEAIRDKVGDKLAVEYRISGDELVPGGLRPDEQIEFAQLIQDKIDLIHVSAGRLYDNETLPRTMPPAYIPHGINVPLAERFKKALKIPVTAVGSINLDMAEQILAENKADMIGIARSLIADPDSVNKARKGTADQIRPCVRCNTCINRTHSHRLPVHCAVNPVVGREAEFVNLITSPVKKKVVVIGGGPAGMEAARRAAERGHEVVLFEKEAVLGGTLVAASSAPFKADMKNYLDWAVHSTVNKTNLTVKLDTEATSGNILAEKPDTLVIAVGAVPFIPVVPGIEKRKVVWAGDVELGKVGVGESVVIVGAGLTGSETALHLAQIGKKVILIDMLPLEVIDADIPLISIIALRKMLNDLQVESRTEVRLEAVTETGVTVTEKNGSTSEIPCDTVVLAMGMTPRSEAVEKLKGLVADTYVIGDSHNQKGNLYYAVSEGFFAALGI